jgi:hypothetical protein
MDTMPEEKEPRLSTLDEIFQPWELVGEARRDCASHRAGFLVPLARLSLLAGGLSLSCPPFGLVGLPLAVVTWRMARRDLDLIVAGDMDHRGYGPTEKARAESRTGLLLILFGTMCWSGLGVCVFLLRLFWPRSLADLATMAHRAGSRDRNRRTSGPRSPAT